MIRFDSDHSNTKLLDNASELRELRRENEELRERAVSAEAGIVVDHGVKGMLALQVRMQCAKKLADYIWSWWHGIGKAALGVWRRKATHGEWEKERKRHTQAVAKLEDEWQLKYELLLGEISANKELAKWNEGNSENETKKLMILNLKNALRRVSQKVIFEVAP